MIRPIPLWCPTILTQFVPYFPHFPKEFLRNYLIGGQGVHWLVGSMAVGKYGFLFSVLLTTLLKVAAQFQTAINKMKWLPASVRVLHFIRAK